MQIITECLNNDFYCINNSMFTLKNDKNINLNHLEAL